VVKVNYVKNAHCKIVICILKRNEYFVSYKNMNEDNIFLFILLLCSTWLIDITFVLKKILQNMW